MQSITRQFYLISVSTLETCQLGARRPVYLGTIRRVDRHASTTLDITILFILEIKIILTCHSPTLIQSYVSLHIFHIPIIEESNSSKENFT